MPHHKVLFNSFSDKELCSVQTSTNIVLVVNSKTFGGIRGLRKGSSSHISSA